MENEEHLKQLLEDYRRGKNYFSTMELDTTVPMCVDFFEGRQWGKIGEKTKKLPRATFNLVELIVNTKLSTMINSPLKVIFNSTDMVKQAERLTKFNHFMEKEIKLDELCEVILEQSAVEGSSFIHFYWDSDAIGKRGEYRGGVRAEKIDLLNVICENPAETDIQKQKWIMLETKQDVELVKSMCESAKARDLIYSDKGENDKFVTVLTRYFKQNNEVYFEKFTKNAIIHRPRPLNPGLIKSKDSFYSFRANLYPVEVYQYKNRKNCIYGRGEVEPIIPNNRTINFNTAMMSKGVEDQGFGTIVQREGALKTGEKISNDSSKVLIDRYKGGQNGFYNLSKTPFTPEAYKLNKDIIETTRLITGTTEIMTGETMYANQSGTSIAYLQQQAMRPLEKLAKRYKNFRKRCAEILYQFYCLFYEDKEFNYIGKDEIQNSELTIKDTFKSSEYVNIDFDINVEIGATNDYSEIAELNLLDNLLKSNLISLKMYYKLYPDHLLPEKERLLEELENQEKSEVNRLKTENENMKSKIEMLEKEAQSTKEIYANLKSTIEQNRSLLSLVSALQNNSKEKDDGIL